MARTSKKTITIDDLLQESNYLSSVAPYQIPQNWCWMQIGSVAELFTGDSINEIIKQKKYAGQTEGLIYIATKDIGFDGVINYETNVRIPDYQSFRIAPENTPLLCIEGGSAGRKVGFTNQPVCFVNKLCAFVAKGILSKYIYYYLVSQYFFDQFNDKKHGLIGGVSVKELSSITIAIPPLAEQQRIVDRIESLFAKLNEAKEKAQAVIDGYEDRKAAIMYKAFTGEYTEKLRATRQKTLNWHNVKLHEICHIITDGTHQTPTYTTESGYVFLSSKNVRNGVIDWDDIKYIPKTLHEELHARIAPQRGDLLLAKNGTTGVAAIVDRDCIFDIYVSLALIRPIQEKVDPRYLLYVINSPKSKEYFDTSLKGIGVPNLHLKYIRETPIPLPQKEEQEEIVHILDDLLGKEQRIKEVATQVIDQIDTMKESILARAFRGELGTNDPNDESAVELLKRVLMEGA